MPRPIPKLSLLLSGLLLALLVAPVVLSAWGPEVGLQDGRLRPCPGTPNCVSSQAEDERQRVAPLALPEGVDARRTYLRFLAAIDARRDARVAIPKSVANPPGDFFARPFAHAEFVTPYLRFRDDVELLLDEAARVVHVRSASRVGRSDLGKNRARVEELRALLAELR